MNIFKTIATFSIALLLAVFLVNCNKEKMLKPLVHKKEKTMNMDSINSEVEKRIQYFLNQFGNEKSLEKFYGQPLDSLRNWGRREMIKMSKNK